MGLKTSAVIAFLGFAAICVGLAAIYWPAAIIFYGAANLAAGLFLPTRSGRKTEEREA